MEVEGGPPVGHPLGEGLGDAGGVGDPDGLGEPEATQVPGFAEHRHPVGGEGEDAVEALGHPGGTECGDQSDAVLPARGEVLLGEGQGGRHDRRFVEGGDGEGVDGHRAVGVGADAETGPGGVRVLAVVQVAVLEPQDRASGCGAGVVAPVEFGQRFGRGVLVGKRQQRYVHPGHRADHRAPEAGGRDDMVGGEGAPVGDDAGDLAVRPLDARDGVPLQEAGAPPLGPCHLRPAGEQGPGQTVVGGVEAAEDGVLVQQGPQLLALLRGEQLPAGRPRRRRVRPCGAGRPSGPRWWRSPGRRGGRSRAARRPPGRRTSGRCTSRTRSWSWTGRYGRPAPARARWSRRGPAAAPAPGR